jgi:MFS family permease
VMRRTSEQTLMVAALAACAGGCALLMTGWLPVVLLAMGLIGVSIVWFNVAGFTLIQRTTPHELLGRVEAALGMALMIPQATSIALGAALIAVVNYRILLLAMAAVFVLCIVEIVGWPGQRGASVTETVPGASQAVPALADGLETAE